MRIFPRTLSFHIFCPEKWLTLYLPSGGILKGKAMKNVGIFGGAHDSMPGNIFSLDLRILFLFPIITITAELEVIFNNFDSSALKFAAAPRAYVLGNSSHSDQVHVFAPFSYLASIFGVGPFTLHVLFRMSSYWG